MLMAFTESSEIFSAPFRITISNTGRIKLSSETDYYTDPNSLFICVYLWYNNMKVKGHIPHWDTFYIYFLLNNYGMAWSLNITGDNQVGIVKRKPRPENLVLAILRMSLLSTGSHSGLLKEFNNTHFNCHRIYIPFGKRFFWGGGLFLLGFFFLFAITCKILWQWRSCESRLSLQDFKFVLPEIHNHVIRCFLFSFQLWMNLP